MNQIREEPGGSGTDKDNIFEVTSASLCHTHALKIYNKPSLNPQSLPGCYAKNMRWAYIIESECYKLRLLKQNE